MTTERNKIQIFWLSKAEETYQFTAQRVYEFINFMYINMGVGKCQLYGKDLNIADREDVVKKIVVEYERGLSKVTGDKIYSDYFSATALSIGFLFDRKYYISVSLGGSKVRNSVFIEHRGDDANSRDFLLYFKHSISYFKPQWGAITAFKFWSDIANQEQNEYRIGWVNYFADNIVLPQAFIEGLRSEKTEAGTIYFITEDEFDYTNKEHVRIGMEKVEILRKHNIVHNV